MRFLYTKGGPIATDTLFYLHTLSDIPGSISISKGLYLNGDFDEIKKYILQGNKISECIRFFLGYSGWDSEQLNNEIRENTWLVSEEEKSYLMKNNIKDMWRTALEKLRQQVRNVVTLPASAYSQLIFYFLDSNIGEAMHLCSSPPLAASFSIIRIERSHKT